MLGVLLAATLAAAAFYDCTSNPNTGACTAPEATACTSKCFLRKTAASCAAFPECNWTQGEFPCYPKDPTLEGQCWNQTQTSSAECAAIAGCEWSTQPCITTPYCGYVNFSDPGPNNCPTAENASSCAALGSKCEMKSSCGLIPTCFNRIRNGQDSGCLATPGCMKIESINNITGPSTVCADCMVDIDANAYLLYITQIGKSCMRASDQGTTLTVKITPSPTGCSGGKPYVPPPDLAVTCTDVPDVTAAAATASTSFVFVVVGLLFTLLA